MCLIKLHNMNRLIYSVNKAVEVLNIHIFSQNFSEINSLQKITPSNSNVSKGLDFSFQYYSLTIGRAKVAKIVCEIQDGVSQFEFLTKSPPGFWLIWHPCKSKKKNSALEIFIFWTNFPGTLCFRQLVPVSLKLREHQFVSSPPSKHSVYTLKTRRDPPH